MLQQLPGWTDIRTETAVTLWTTTDSSAADIAAVLGGVSRSAVLGKLKRLGKLGTRRPKTSTPAEKVAKPPRRARRRKPAPHQRLHLYSPRRIGAAVGDIGFTKASPYLTATMVGVEATLALQAGQCRWPYGEAKRGIAYCGRAADGSYCDFHHRLGYQRTTRARKSQRKVAPVQREVRR